MLWCLFPKIRLGSYRRLKTDLPLVHFATKDENVPCTQNPSSPRPGRPVTPSRVDGPSSTTPSWVTSHDKGTPSV